jgi:Glycine-zipper domain
MKRIAFVAVLIMIASQLSSRAQTQPAPASTQKSLAATLGIYVFPSQGQNATTQSQDESACYKWAVQNTGVDPFNAAKQNQQQQAQAQAQAQGAQSEGVRGAARGAAGGALIGAIAGDAGTGAAIGAATGAVVGRSRRKQAESQAAQQSASSQQATAQQMDAFKKAFGACMEAKKYIVK